ncbi:MAG: glycosyltransferase family 2 protein [Bacteroidales bacterium]|nr:glycosyltransferase family 2 protein [Bacteroidales bacterium]
MKNILELSGYDVTDSYLRFFGITTITIAKPIKERLTKSKINSKYSVSIIVPARNEEGNIGKIIPSIPKFGKWQEIVFVEGNSKDKTWEVIEKQVEKYKKSKYIKVKAFKQKGRGKADAVKIGFEKAKGQILMIYDADRTVEAHDLKKFYNVLAAGKAKFVNGSRLVYPMEQDAMRTLNKIGNKFFSIVFTYILGIRFKDTLCGTKVLFKKDLEKYKRYYKRYLRIDPFGDFALIFMAVKNKMKVVEIPIRYKERVYGSTNINRFRHGLLLFKMAYQALLEFKIK